MAVNVNCYISFDLFKDTLHSAQTARSQAISKTFTYGFCFIFEGGYSADLDPVCTFHGFSSGQSLALDSLNERKKERKKERT